jgi:lysyl-tRNA synthetase class 2
VALSPKKLKAILEKRAWLYATIREFMTERQVLEVETPLLNIAGNTDPYIDSLSLSINTSSSNKPVRHYLHTSPEFYMKRLLAQGSDSIYQICRVFRDKESGKNHSPEFSMLEYYRLEYDHYELMDEINKLLNVLGLGAANQQTYADVFFEKTSINPHTATDDDLHILCQKQGIENVLHTRSEMLDLIFSHQVCPELGIDRPVFIHDYPACQAAQAHLSTAEPVIAERFELFINGIEIANGYKELQDTNEYISRFDEDNSLRKILTKPEIVIDAAFIQDLKQGLPNCAGVAIGLDRLLMVLSGSNHIEDVLAFC